MSTTQKLPIKPLEDFIEDHVKGEPLSIDTVKWAIRKYVYMNYEPNLQEKLRVYENLLYNIADLLDGKQPLEVQKLLTNIRNWAMARRNTKEEEDAYEALALQNETFYNLPKRK